MKKIFVLLLLLIFVFSFTGCSKENEAQGKTPDGDQTTSEETGVVSNQGDHIHQLATGNNIVEHEAVGYCGNTMTTVKYNRPDEADKSWEKSFWGGASVKVTDLLTYLDYSEDICKCLPEYTIDTEFGEGYGVSLSEGYARHGDKQASLTEEQLTFLREVIGQLEKAEDGAMIEAIDC